MLAEPVQVVRRQHVLEPVDVVRRQRAGHLTRRGGIPGHVAVEHEESIRAQMAAGGFGRGRGVFEGGGVGTGRLKGTLWAVKPVSANHSGSSPEA